MKTCLLALFVSGVFVGCSRPAPALGTLKAKATEMLALARSKQYGEYVDLLYPTLIERAGGRSELIEELRRVNREAAEHDVKTLRVDVGEPGEAVVSDGKVFAIVPTETEIDTPTATTTRKGYLLAISDDQGATWKFLEGSRLTTARTYLLVPDLPSGLKFPKDESPVVVNKPAPEPCEPSAPTPTPSRSALQIRVIEVAHDMIGGAYHQFAASLYPPLVQGFGGPDKAAAIFAGAVRANVTAGRALASSVEVDEPGEFATQGGRTFAVVRATFRAENAKQKFVRHGVFLAISEDGGENWTFIPGITPKIAARLQTLSLPPELKIPEPEPTVVTNK